MKLQEFVSQSEIIADIVEAQEGTWKAGASITPSLQSFTREHPYGQTKARPNDPVMLVEFDVAVTATRSTGKRGSIRVGIGNIGLGGQGQSSEVASDYPRLKFKIPVVCPGIEGE